MAVTVHISATLLRRAVLTLWHAVLFLGLTPVLYRAKRHACRVVMYFFYVMLQFTHRNTPRDHACLAWHVTSCNGHVKAV
jgi:hypothetical protein